MAKYTAAFCITPLPRLVDKYPNIIDDFYKSRNAQCVDTKSRSMII